MQLLGCRFCHYKLFVPYLLCYVLFHPLHDNDLSSLALKVEHLTTCINLYYYLNQLYQLVRTIFVKKSYWNTHNP